MIIPCAIIRAFTQFMQILPKLFLDLKYIISKYIVYQVNFTFFLIIPYKCFLKMSLNIFRIR